MTLAAVDWTGVIEAMIYGLPAILGALFAGVVLLKVRTPSGKSLGEVAEYAHDTAIANNLLLSKQNGPTKTAVTSDLKQAGTSPPQVPSKATNAR